MQIHVFQSEVEMMRVAIEDLAPDLKVESIMRIPSAGVQTLWTVSLAHACQPLVLCGPPEIRRKHALRSESDAVTIEVAAVQWLASLPVLGTQPRKDANIIIPGGLEPGQSIANYSGDPVNVCYVSDFVPKLFRFFPRGMKSANKPLALWRSTPGITVAQLDRALTDAERDTLDFEKGQLFRRLACHISPTGNFGPIGDILRTESRVPMYQALGLFDISPGDEVPTDIGRKNWSSCFKGYLEEVGFDLNDFHVNLNLDAFRGHFERFKHLLDKVKTPRLVALGGADDANTMITVREEKAGRGVKMTGLRDWSNFCFGDPLMAYVFQDGNSPAFQRGTETSFSDLDPLQQDPLIEDRANAPVRLALYKAWHAACGVAREYRQDRRGEIDIEMAWRRKFMEAMKTLENFESVDSNENSHPHRARIGGRL